MDGGTTRPETNSPGLGFDRVAELYGTVRPTYPAPLITAALELVPSRPDIVEVGPATGQATASLLDAGARVTAVEPGEQLASVLRRRFAGNTNLDVVVTTFEQAPLEPESADAVVAATSYHWIEPAARFTKPASVLRPDGVLAVIDTNQVDDPADGGYFDRVQGIYERFGEARGRAGQTADSVIPPIIRQMEADPSCIDISLIRHRADQTYPSARYADLLRTYSGSQAMPEPAREQMIAELVAVVDDEYDGIVVRPIVFTLATCRFRSGQPGQG